ncbi:hypothetical protein TGAM01_v208685 [Trichoderma gamsii]|uniref:Uncharacterized protein n=2 Tax=Trichoderma gamsii TaxID=398673 RepID=A0A2P4ZDP4_9HYPO|nr:hypothetical protein TGAM01_v208685 [Trichoderma gamsii]PON22404.1 hypothetical protein TGAM01_v208685 [Trichoderma gamsii]
MVRLVLQNKVKRFDGDVSSVAIDANKKQLLRLKDMDIEIIYRSTLQIEACFELFQTIARMYYQMHINHVSKGMDSTEMLEKTLVTMAQTFVAAVKTGAAAATEHVEENMPQSLAIRVSEDLSI